MTLSKLLNLFKPQFLSGETKSNPFSILHYLVTTNGTMFIWKYLVAYVLFGDVQTLLYIHAQW